MNRSDAWYATVQHYRAWLFADGGFSLKYQASGEFTPELVRRMARYYSVSRTIPSVVSTDDKQKPGADRNRQIVADELNNLAAHWPERLTDRSERIIVSAQSVRTRIGKGYPPYSALSKFIWFARGENWTPYDFLASAGMSAGGNTSVEKIRAFYSALKPHLPVLVERMQPVCDTSGFTLRSEKIADIFLMLRGARRVRPDFASDLIAGCDDFMALLPSDVAERLDACGRQISELLTPDALPQLPLLPGISER